MTGKDNTDFKLQLPSWYKNNNPNIIKHIESSIRAGNSHFLFQGVVGCGKTTLAKMVYNQIPKRNDDYLYKVRYLNVRELSKRYHHIFYSSYVDKANQIRSLEFSLSPSYVVLDDIGTELDIDLDHKFIGDIIEDRYERIKAEHLFTPLTILTTNLSGEELRNYYGDRVVDRICEMCVICKFTPKSFRKMRVINS